MKLAVLKERRDGETRVAATPETVKKFKGLGLDVAVETGAGARRAISPMPIMPRPARPSRPMPRPRWTDADIVLKVRGPDGRRNRPDEEGRGAGGAAGAAYAKKTRSPSLAAQGVTAFAMEFLPRISRAQAMDVLSSPGQSRRLQGGDRCRRPFGRAMPMMMTAAGTIAPARVLVMGVGVAGLQAIATAKRLGAIVSATDVRPATKEQVESLGGTFVAVMDEEFKNAQTAAGYAKEMSAEYQAKQAALIAETIKKQDIVITTALIPGRKAPVLVTRRDDQDHEAGFGDRGSGGGARAATRR